MDRIQAAIVGCGRISDLHALGYRGREDARITAWRNRLVEMGLNDERNDVLTAMFEEMEGQITPEQLKLLFERVAGRVRRMDRELEKGNVLSTARLEEVDSTQWQQRADDPRHQAAEHGHTRADAPLPDRAVQASAQGWQGCDPRCHCASGC